MSEISKHVSPTFLMLKKSEMSDLKKFVRLSCFVGKNTVAGLTSKYQFKDQNHFDHNVQVQVFKKTITHNTQATKSREFSGNS